MRSVNDLAVHVGMTAACQAFGLNRGFVYRDRARHRAIGPRRAPPARPRPPLSLSADIVRVVGNPTNVGWVAPVPNVAALREKWACKWLAGT